jgi:hypothetical protein
MDHVVENQRKPPPSHLIRLGSGFTTPGQCSVPAWDVPAMLLVALPRGVWVT